MTTPPTPLRTRFWSRIALPLPCLLTRLRPFLSRGRGEIETETEKEERKREGQFLSSRRERERQKEIEKDRKKNRKRQKKRERKRKRELPLSSFWPIDSPNGDQSIRSAIVHWFPLHSCFHFTVCYCPFIDSLFNIPPPVCFILGTESECVLI